MNNQPIVTFRKGSACFTRMEEAGTYGIFTAASGDEETQYWGGAAVNGVLNPRTDVKLFMNLWIKTDH